MKKIVAVILEFNQPQMTLETVRSLKAATVPQGWSLETVVVDNSPLPDSNLKKSLKKFRQVKLFATLKNTGFAQGNNLGIKWGLRHGADYLLLLNNDVIVDRRFLEYLVAADTDIAVPKIYFAKGYEYHKDRYRPHQRGRVIWYAGGEFDWKNVWGEHFGVNQVDRHQFDRIRKIDFANFCCVLIKKAVFLKIGFLSSRYFIYWEDADFSRRAALAGFTQKYIPQSVVWHRSSGSSGSGSQLHDYYLTRNRLIFGFKYAQFRTKFALLRQAVGQLVFGRPGQKRGILDFITHHWGKTNWI